jgi:F-type H+-transporting ATPase subunit gamma
MANARLIKRRITAAKNISKITKAMEMVAASKMKRAQEQATAARPYARALEISLQKVAQDSNPDLHPLLNTYNQGHPVLVVISTDKGLCGSLNTQLLKATMSWFEQYPDGKVIAIGKKAVHFCQISGFDILAQFTDLPEKISTADILPITSLVISNFTNQTFSLVTLVYMDFINTLSQKVRSVQLLPMSSRAITEDVMAAPTLVHEYTFEPSAKELLAFLLPYFLENTVYQAFLEARASEHSARMVTMKNASENANSLVGELKLEYNKSRQAAITSELLDITTASMTIS